MPLQNPIVQTSAGCNVLLVQPREVCATLFVLHTIAAFIAEDLMMQLRLITAERLHQRTSDGSEKLLLDDLQRSFHIAVRVDRLSPFEVLAYS